MIAPIEKTSVFAASYDLLGRLYLGGPDAVRPSVLPALDSLLVALRDLDPTFPSALSSLLPRTDHESETLQQTFLDHVVAPILGRYTPPYASFYLDGGTLWGPSSFDVLRKYEAEGLTFQAGVLRGPGGTIILAPDHVGVEMAFLAVLASHRPNQRRGAQIDFFLGHLASWLPQLAAAYRSAEDEIGFRWTNWALAIVEADLALRAPTDRERSG